MFKYIAQILKSFTPAQRLSALVVLVIAITAITLGPNWIDSNTNDCAELETRIKSLETQNEQLNTRVTALNTQLIQGQQECTDNLISKQQEIMGLINGMIDETQSGIKKCETPVRREVVRTEVEESQDPNQPKVAMMVLEPEPQPAPESVELKKMLTKLKKLKTQVKQTMADGQ